MGTDIFNKKIIYQVVAVLLVIVPVTAFAAPPPFAIIEKGVVTVTGGDTNGNGIIENAQDGKFKVTLNSSSYSLNKFFGVTANLTTTDTRISIIDSSATYGDIDVGTSKGPTDEGFIVRVPGQFGGGAVSFGIQISYKDADGTSYILAESIPLSITIEKINHVPVLTTIGNKTVAEAQALTFTISATDADGNTLTYSASNLPSGATFTVSTRTFSWTPTHSQIGTYPNVHFQVTDGIATAAEDITITAVRINNLPVLNSIGNRSVTENKLLTFTISATDPDGDSITYTTAGLPSGASFNASTKTFTWTPTHDQIGPYPNVHFQVTDGLLIDSEDITITVILAKTPVAEYHFSEGTGTIANDSSGNGNNGTITGTDIVWTTGKIGTGLNFNDAYDGVNCGQGASLNIRNAITLMTWFKPSVSSASTYNFLIAKSANHSYQLKVDRTTNKVYAIIWTATGTYTLSGNTAFSLDAWHHYAVTYDGATFNVYLDGKLDGTKSATGLINDSAAYDLFIGRYSAVSNSYAAQGIIDEVKIYNTALTADEIAAEIASVPTNLSPYTPAAPYGPTSAILGASCQFTASTTDPETDQIKYIFDWGDGTTTTTAYYASGATASASHAWSTTSGTYSVKVKAVDKNNAESGWSSASQIIISTQSNSAPVLGSIGNKSITAGTILTFTISATDVDGDTLTYLASNLPSGATFTVSTRTFSWTPTTSQVGTYPNVHFQVSDGIIIDSEDIAITVTLPSSTAAEYHLDEGYGNMANDSSGNGNTGIITGSDIAWTTGKIGTGLNFNDSADGINCGKGASLNIRNAITLMVWFKPATSSISTYDFLIAKSANHSYQLKFYRTSRKIYGVIWTNSGMYTLTGSTILSLGAWHHLAVTYDGAILSVYADGKLDGTKAATGTINDSSAYDFLIGKYSSTSNSYIAQGVIDEIKVYSTALSAAEIAAEAAK